MRRYGLRTGPFVASSRQSDLRAALDPRSRHFFISTGRKRVRDPSRTAAADDPATRVLNILRDELSQLAERHADFLERVGLGLNVVMRLSYGAYGLWRKRARHPCDLEPLRQP